MPSVSEAVKRDLDSLPAAVRASALAATAVMIAARLDREVGARDLADLSRELRIILSELKAAREPDDEAAKLLAELTRPL